MSHFDLHFDTSQARLLAAKLDPARLRALKLGAASAGFQSEGGYNGAGEPQNNWSGWEGRAGFAASGGAARFWQRYAEDAALLAAHGLRVFRFSLEWARLEPDASPNQTGGLDQPALEQYARIIASFLDAGVEPLLTLYHWTHPKNLGADLWLDDASPARFTKYLAIMLPRLLDALESLGHKAPRRFITFNEPNMFAVATYLAGRFPHRAQVPAEPAARAPLGDHAAPQALRGAGI
jgi:beta-glucosidase